MDFVFDRTAEGRVLKGPAIVDDATNEAVAIEVDRSISGHGVARALDPLAPTRGLPKVIRTDSGNSAPRRWWRGPMSKACSFA